MKHLTKDIARLQRSTERVLQHLEDKFAKNQTFKNPQREQLFEKYNLIHFL